MDSDLQELIEAAITKTKAQRLKWLAFDGESFRTPIGTGYLHINRGSTRMENDDGDSYPATTYTVQVSDEQGRVVAESEATMGFAGYSALLADLFEAARRSALKTDKVIGGMLEALRGS